MRNLSINKLFARYAANHHPEFHFGEGGNIDWRAWRDALQPKVLATLGKRPTAVPLSVEILAEWSEAGLIKQKIVFDVEPGLSATAYVFRPTEALEPLPAILCCHGHGPYAKEGVMGVCSSDAVAAKNAQDNADFGLQMARAGFVTMAIDWRGFGERDDRAKPHSWNYQAPDLCNAHFLRAAILGYTMLGMNVHDGRCALDCLSQQSYVDRDRIGIMGLSFGGTMATWIALADDRVKAVDVICYSDSFAQFGLRDVNFCGSQITPGLYDLCDVSDLQGLIAPRPLLVEIGIYDQCFLLEGAKQCWQEVQRIYKAAGASDVLELDLFPGGHRWGGNKSIGFFRKYLGRLSENQ
jgi:dienelactone hydrolase